MAARQPTEEIKTLETPADVARRSDRVQMSIPIEAIGIDYNRGRPFCHRGQTLAVSRHGAAIVLNYALATDQELTIRCVDTKKEAVARVVGIISGAGNDLVYGVAFLNVEANPWGIEFPPLTGAEEGLGRILLACRMCQAHRVFHLNEIELQVFETNQGTQQFCQSCSATTSWKRVENENYPKSSLSPEVKAQESPKSQPHDKRKHRRVGTNIPACIRQSGFMEEAVTCENVSRGGLRLRASKPYKKSSLIEVALPYSAGASGNIFVSARVIHVQDCGRFFELGVAYAGAAGTTSAYSGSSSVRDRKF